MDLYTPFVERVEKSLVTQSPLDAVRAWTDPNALLRGETSAAALRDLIPVEKLRSIGSFFTSSRMAETLWGDVIEELSSSSVVVDPACGAGDLLIPAVQRLAALGTSRSIHEQVRGIDLEPGFIAATKARLLLASRLTNPCRDEAEFSNVSTGDFFNAGAELLRDATHVVLNPPFILMDAPEDCGWGSKGVNAAALFLDQCAALSRAGCIIMAILPEVLRSGTRYARWRSHIQAQAASLSVTSLGQFDVSTDIDVFRLVMTVGRPSLNHSSTISRQNIWQPEISGMVSLGETLNDHFEVKVGPVVPHRHPDEGDDLPFLTARGLPSWSVIDAIDTRRKFKGRTHKGPFVVIRRTSRPGEPQRARATVITSKHEIAVENHLIVLTPRDGSLDKCLQLMDHLKLPETTIYLDYRIKCRHLTVGAVRDIPWPIKEKPRHG